MTNLINLSERREAKAQEAAQSEPAKPELTPEEAKLLYVEKRKNVLDFLTSTLVVANQRPSVLDAVVFLKDPETGHYMPGATSQATMDELLKLLGSEMEIKAMPEGGDE